MVETVYIVKKKFYIWPMRNFCMIVSCKSEEKTQTALIQKLKNAQIWIISSCP